MKYINKPSKITAILVVILFSLFIGRDLLKPGFFNSHDGLYHVIRLHQFDLSFRSGQIPVRWAPTLLGGIGYPLFIVNYTLPYYTAEAFLFSGLTIFTSIKLTLLLSLVGGAISSYFVFYSWNKHNFGALVGSFLYTIAPYHLVNVFERGAVGEAFAYIFAPLLFHSSVVILILGLTGIILSHTVIAIMFIPAAFLFQPKKKFIFATLIACLLSAFQLLPIIFERRYMQFDTNLLSYYLGHFRPLSQLLRIPLAGINIGTRFQVGIVHSLMVVFGLTLAHKTAKRKILVLTALVVISLFFITPASKPFWNYLPLAKFILYPWRWLGVIMFASSGIAAMIIPHKHSTVMGIILIVMSLYAYRHYIKVDEYRSTEFPFIMLYGNGTTQNEFDPIWYTQREQKFTTPVESLSKNAQISTTEISPNNWKAIITANEPTTIKFNLLYFPGWEVKINNILTHIIPTGGLIHFTIPSGIHQVTARFTETPIRQAGNIITAMTGLSLIVFYALRFRPH